MSDAGLHERFTAWLEAGAVGDPPRDLAFHAALCPACAQWIAAQDALATVDTGLAALPASRPAAADLRGGLRPAGRFAAAAGGVLVVGGLLAFGIGSVLSGSLTLFPDRAGEVLSATGSPGTTAGAPAASATAVSAQPTSSPEPAASPSPEPGATASSPTRVVGTPRPTPQPTATPRRTSSPSPSVTASATPAPTTTPSASAMPSPTPSATPTPSPTPEPPTPSP